MLSLLEIEKKFLDISDRCLRGEDVQPIEIKRLLTVLPEAAEAELGGIAGRVPVPEADRPQFNAVIRQVGEALGQAIEELRDAKLAEVAEVEKMMQSERTNAQNK